MTWKKAYRDYIRANHVVITCSRYLCKCTGEICYRVEFYSIDNFEPTHTIVTMLVNKSLL